MQYEYYIFREKDFNNRIFKLNYEKFKKSSHENNWIDNSIIKENRGIILVIPFIKTRKVGDIM